MEIGIDFLKKVIETMLPSILSKPASSFRSMYIDYEMPHVRRLFVDLQMDGVPFRLCLHQFEECKTSEAYVHFHPWKSAMYVIPGEGSKYEVGFGTKSEDPSSEFQIYGTVEVDKPMFYEMANPFGAHYVKPTGTTYTVFISGLPIWKHGASKPKTKQRELTEQEKEEVLQFFVSYFNTNK